MRSLYTVIINKRNEEFKMTNQEFEIHIENFLSHMKLLGLEIKSVEINDEKSVITTSNHSVEVYKNHTNYIIYNDNKNISQVYFNANDTINKLVKLQSEFVQTEIKEDVKTNHQAEKMKSKLIVELSKYDLKADYIQYEGDLLTFYIEGFTVDINPEESSYAIKDDVGTRIRKFKRVNAAVSFIGLLFGAEKKEELKEIVIADYPELFDEYDFIPNSEGYVSYKFKDKKCASSKIYGNAKGKFFISGSIKYYTKLNVHINLEIINNRLSFLQNNAMEFDFIHTVYDDFDYIIIRANERGYICRRISSLGGHVKSTINKFVDFSSVKSAFKETGF